MKNFIIGFLIALNILIIMAVMLPKINLGHPDPYRKEIFQIWCGIQAYETEFKTKPCDLKLMRLWCNQEFGGDIIRDSPDILKALIYNEKAKDNEIVLVDIHKNKYILFNNGEILNLESGLRN